MKNTFKTCAVWAVGIMMTFSCSEEQPTPGNSPDQGLNNEIAGLPRIECVCEDGFENVKKGTYRVGSKIPGKCAEAITVEEFYLLGGGTANGNVTVEPAPRPHMSGQTLFTGNANMRFELPCTVDGLCLSVYDAGGNLNIEVNGDFVNFANFQDIDGTSIGGTQVSVEYDNNGVPIRICLHGHVSSFMIGGQELFIDDLCLGECVEECQCLIDFESTNPGPYSVGDGAQLDECLEARFTDFQWYNGQWTNGGTAFLNNAPKPYMSGQAMQLANINMQLLLPCTIDGLCMDVAEFGGNLNLHINGDFVNFRSYADIDGMTIGGVDVHVYYGPDGKPQRVCFDGPIKKIFFGGQEFFVDNICLGPCL